MQILSLVLLVLLLFVWIIIKSFILENINYTILCEYYFYNLYGADQILNCYEEAKKENSSLEGNGNGNENENEIKNNCEIYTQKEMY